LLSNPHPAIRNMFLELNQDPFAQQVISHVTDGPFGPRALARYANEYDSGTTRAVSSNDPQASELQSRGTVPNNDWQLHAVRTMIARSQAQEYAQASTSASTSAQPLQLSYLQVQGSHASSGRPETHISQQQLYSPTAESGSSMSPTMEELFGAWGYDSFFHPGANPQR